jgi:ABC-type transport system substrate-binding protein
MCDAMVTEPDPVIRAGLIQGLVKTLYDEAMSIPICTYAIVYAFGKNVGGGETYAPVSSHLQCPEGLWLEK